MAGAGHVFLYQRGCPGMVGLPYGRSCRTELPVMAVSVLGLAPGLATARQWGHGPAGEPGLRVVGGPRTPAGTRVSNAQ